MYKQNDIVDFNNGVIKGYGKIKGIATVELPVMGRTFIVEILECDPKVPNETYPFDTTVVAECHIKLKFKNSF